MDRWVDLIDEVPEGRHGTRLHARSRGGNNEYDEGLRDQVFLRMTNEKFCQECASHLLGIRCHVAHKRLKATPAAFSRDTISDILSCAGFRCVTVRRGERMQTRTATPEMKCHDKQGVPIRSYPAHQRH